MRYAIVFLLTAAAAPPATAVDGDYDTSFSAGGQSVDYCSDYSTNIAAASAVQPDGRIVLMGDIPVTHGPTTDTDFGVERVLSNGEYDEEFGNIPDYGCSQVDMPLPGGTGHDHSAFVALAPDGGMFVGGTSEGADAYSGHAGVARLTSGGEIDTRWATNGRWQMLRPSVDSEFHDALVLPDGKLVVVGTYVNPAELTAQDRQFWILRFTADGRLDDSFGRRGELLVPFVRPASTDRTDVAYAVARTPDGGLVVAGTSTADTSTKDSVIAIAKLQANGVLDSSFGSGGKVIYDRYPGDDVEVRRVAVDSHGRIFLGGNDLDLNDKFDHRHFVMCLQPNGALDRSFSGDGVLDDGVFVAGTPGNRREPLSALLVQSDDKIVIGGSSTDTPTHTSFAVARLLEDGSYDLRFGANGVVTFYFRDFSRMSALGSQNGRLIVTGTTARDAALVDSAFYFARLSNDLIFTHHFGD